MVNSTSTSPPRDRCRNRQLRDRKIWMRLMERSWLQRQGEAYLTERSVIRDDDVGGRSRVTRDKEQVL